MLLPAPFSPSSACTWPGATERLIPSFATSGPNLLVMPLSSSSTGVVTSLNCQVTGALVGVGIEPLSMPAWTVFSSLCSAAGTLLA